MRRGLLVAASTATVAAGCGGGAPDSPSQLQRQATRICTAAAHRLKRITSPDVGAANSSPASAAHDSAFLRRGLAVLEPELRQLERLRARGEDRDVYAAALRTRTAEIADVKRAIAALDRQQDPALAFASLQNQLRPLVAQGNGTWRALEIPACLSR